LEGDLAGNKIAAATGITISAVPAVPADSDPLALYPSDNAYADRVNYSGDFMSRNPRVLDTRPHSLLGHGITVANSTSLNLYTHMPGTRICDLAFNEFKWAAGTSYLNDSHL
jgi:hypothetical protein